MSKFKVGDKVRVTNVGSSYSMYRRFMDEHAREYISSWKPGMGINEGCVGIVVAHAPHEKSTPKIYVINTQKGNVYMVGEDGLTLEYCTPNNKIVITTDGKITLARLYEGDKVVKSTEAKCCPSDEFVFETGAKLAFNRLVFGTDYDPDDVKIKAKDFDWDAFKKEKIAVHCDTETKAKAFLKECHDHGFTWTGPDKENLLRNTFWNSYEERTCYDGESGKMAYSPTEFYSEEGYTIVGYPFAVTTEKKVEKKYWNGKAVCIDNEGHNDYWTVGKAYVFKDGSTIADAGWTSWQYKSLAEINGEVPGSNRLGAKFIEFKGE